MVNLTPVEADGPGYGQLVSSSVVVPPEASNVNFGPGSFDPNVAVAPIGADGQVCYVNSISSVHVIADHLGTFSGSVFTPAAASGAPDRKLDTRGETPPTTTAAPTTTVPSSRCDRSYPTVCIPSPPPDLNCPDIPHRNFVVLQPDPHNFDGNNDGIGCVG